MTPSRSNPAGGEPAKQKALDSALAEITKSYGTGAIMRLGRDGPIQEIQGISAGSVSVDLALGGKGFPRGRVVEIYGPESSGKTTLTLHVVANAQKQGGICAFVDAEHALDPSYARKLGRRARRPAWSASRTRVSRRSRSSRRSCARTRSTSS